MLPMPGDEQDDLHRVAVLAHERAPARLRLRLGEPVRPELLLAELGLGRVQPHGRVDAQRRGDLVAREARARRWSPAVSGRQGLWSRPSFC